MGHQSIDQNGAFIANEVFHQADAAQRKEFDVDLILSHSPSPIWRGVPEAG